MGSSDSGTHGLNALGTMLLEVGDLVEQTLQVPLFLGLRIASESLKEIMEKGEKTYDARVQVVQFRVTHVITRLSRWKR